jgi:hypothetical protein
MDSAIHLPHHPGRGEFTCQISAGNQKNRSPVEQPNHLGNIPRANPAICTWSRNRCAHTHHRYPKRLGYKQIYRYST